MPAIPQDSAMALEDLLAENAEFKQHAQIYQALMEFFPTGIILTDRHLNVLVCNEQQKRLLEYPPNMFTGRMPTLPELFRFNALRGEYGPGNPDDLFAEKMALVEKRIPHCFERMRPDGRVLEIRGVPLPEGGFVTSYADITERRQRDAQLLLQATRDSLTGLEGRTGLTRHFEIFRARVSRLAEGFALHCIDLDNFKPINDKHGHLLGDRLLQSVAQRLLSAVRDTDIVVRYGGDEFIVLQSNVRSKSDAKILAGRLVKKVTGVYRLDDGESTIEVAIGASIGVIIANEAVSEIDLAQMIERADAAMYACKSGGAGGYCIDGCKDRETCASAVDCEC
ncbi:MAG: diguanylate cyclase [Aestuariivirga sp.]